MTTTLQSVFPMIIGNVPLTDTLILKPTDGALIGGQTLSAAITSTATNKYNLNTDGSVTFLPNVPLSIPSIVLPSDLTISSLIFGQFSPNTGPTTMSTSLTIPAGIALVDILTLSVTTSISVAGTPSVKTILDLFNLLGSFDTTGKMGPVTAPTTVSFPAGYIFPTNYGFTVPDGTEVPQTIQNQFMANIGIQTSTIVIICVACAFVLLVILFLIFIKQ